jgi:hypothetical protein
MRVLGSPKLHWGLALGTAAVMLWAGNPRVTIPLLPLMGGSLVVALSRTLSDDRWLGRIALAHLVGAVALTAALYAISGSHHPAVQALVFKEQKGFWTFSGDGFYYHQRGAQIAHSLRHGVPVPDMDPTYGGGYMGIVGLLYAGLGTHVLVAPLVNAVLGAFSVILVYVLARSLAAPSAARWAAVGAAIWPSPILWTTQVMKDALSLFLILSMLALVSLLISRSPWNRSWLRVTVAALGLFVAAVVLHTLRHYLVTGLLFVLVITLAYIALTSWRSLRLSHAVAVGAVVLALMTARTIGSNFHVIAVNPTNSVAARAYRQAVELEAQNRLLESRAQYERTIALRDNFWPAYRKLGELSLKLGDLAAAETNLTRYLELNPFDYSPELVRGAIDELRAARARQRAPAAPVVTQPERVAEVRPSTAGRATEAETIPRQPTPKTSVAAVPRPPSSPAPAPAPLTPLPLTAAAAGVREELLKQFAHASQQYKGGDVMLMNVDTLATRLSGHAEPPEQAPAVAPPSIDIAGQIRNGFILTGGDTLYTREMVTPSMSVLQWVKWTPRAFATVLASPFPWQWWKGGRVDPLRTAMGLESLIVVVLLPFALRGAWRIVRSGPPGGILLVLFFLAMTAAFGLTIINVGTLVRIRVPVVFVLFVIVAATGKRTRKSGCGSGG